jgi:hypothetical protein
MEICGGQLFGRGDSNRPDICAIMYGNGFSERAGTASNPKAYPVAKAEPSLFSGLMIGGSDGTDRPSLGEATVQRRRVSLVQFYDKPELLRASAHVAEKDAWDWVGMNNVGTAQSQPLARTTSASEEEFRTIPRHAPRQYELEELVEVSP